MRRKTVQELESTKEMTGLVEQACLVAKDAAFNLRDFLENSSNMAFIAVQDCEKELDRAERKIDDGITHAITQVTEVEAARSEAKGGRQVRGRGSGEDQARQLPPGPGDSGEGQEVALRCPTNDDTAMKTVATKTGNR